MELEYELELRLQLHKNCLCIENLQLYLYRSIRLGNSFLQETLLNRGVNVLEPEIGFPEVGLDKYRKSRQRLSESPLRL